MDAKTSLLAASAALAILCGCRRQDFREHSFSVPGMTEANVPAIRKAVSFYDGVDRDSLVFDTAAKTLTLRFDSMKVAQTNIRMAIEAAGVEVEYPAKKPGEPAGYINARAPRVP